MLFLFYFISRFISTPFFFFYSFTFSFSFLVFNDVVNNKLVYSKILFNCKAVQPCFHELKLDFYCWREQTTFTLLRVTNPLHCSFYAVSFKRGALIQAVPWHDTSGACIKDFSPQPAASVANGIDRELCGSRRSQVEVPSHHCCRHRTAACRHLVFWTSKWHAYLARNICKACAMCA